ncbi:MAG: hypothetical protein ACLPXT_01005 [Terracidiphilus sp.]
MKIVKVLFCAFLIVAGLGRGVAAHAKVVEDVPGSLQGLTSIGDSLDAPDKHPVHLLYIHGINAVGAGDSSLLRDSICTELKLCKTEDWKNAGTEYADKGEFSDGSNPPPLNYLGSSVWNNASEWHAAAPFVVHWVVHLKNHPSVFVVDEINWWPLVLSLKCRNIVTGEAYLAGPNTSLLEVCSQQSKQDPGGLGRFYPWITVAEANELAKKPAHAVLINRTVKNGLLDWGFSDAMLAVGPLGDILREGLRQLIVKSVEFDVNQSSAAVSGNQKRQTYNWETMFREGKTEDREYIGVTHSLGSYLLFNTLNLEGYTSPADASPTAQASASDKMQEDNAVEYVFARTSLIYFFANQIPLLEFTNLEDKDSRAARFKQLIGKWAQVQGNFQSSMHPGNDAARKKIQVVAWSDPGDLLTWRVPPIGDVNVVNLYVQNATHWFWLLESPTGAHDNYAKNKQVLRVMFGNTAHSGGH